MDIWCTVNYGDDTNNYFFTYNKTCHFFITVITTISTNMPSKKRNTTTMFMTTLAIMNQYNDTPTPKRRRIDTKNTVEMYTHTFEELYCADALLMLSK